MSGQTMAPQETQLSMPLPMGLETRIYVHLTIQEKSIMLFLTTASSDESSQATPMGSFVCALPNLPKPSEPISTPLFSVEATVEFTTRVAKLIARKCVVPVYVGNSMSFASAIMGGSVEEEMEAFRKVCDTVVDKIQAARSRPKV